MQLRYVGPVDALDVPLPYGGTVTVKRGEEVKLPNSLAEELLKQKTNWEKAQPGPNLKGGIK